MKGEGAVDNKDKGRKGLSSDQEATQSGNKGERRGREGCPCKKATSVLKP